MSEKKERFPEYKGKPLVRSGNTIYYGNMNDPYVIMLQINSTKNQYDMDMAEKLAWLDEAYLAAYDKIDIDSHIEFQPLFTAPVESVLPYPLTEDEDEKQQTYLSWSTLAGDELDPKQYVGFQILEYAVLSAPGAP